MFGHHRDLGIDHVVRLTVPSKTQAGRPFSANGGGTMSTITFSMSWLRLGLALGLAFIVGFGLAELVAIVWRWWRR